MRKVKIHPLIWFLIVILSLVILVKKLIHLAELNNQNEGKATRKATIIKKPHLSTRQQSITKVFETKNQLEIDDIKKVLKSVHERTIRRELSKLEELGIVKKVGKTKGSYYVKV